MYCHLLQLVPLEVHLQQVDDLQQGLQSHEKLVEEPNAILIDQDLVRFAVADLNLVTTFSVASTWIYFCFDINLFSPSLSLSFFLLSKQKGHFNER